MHLTLPSGDDDTPAAMRILTRYVLFELLKVFSVTLTALTLIMLIFFVVEKALEQGLAPAQFVQLVPYILPDALRFTLPATILFATSLVYGAMSGSNEVVAVKASGVSPLSILWPAYVVAVLLSLGTVFLNDMAVSWGRAGIQRVVLHSLEDIAYSALQKQRRFDSKRFSISVRTLRGRTLVQPTLTVRPKNGKGGVTVRAESAEIRCDLDQGLLVFYCRGAKIKNSGAVTASFDEFSYAFPLEDASGSNPNDRHPSRMSLADIREDIPRQRDEIRNLRAEMAADAAFTIVAGDFQELAPRHWRVEQSVLKNAENRLARLHTEPHRRWSTAFSCLCFVMVGAPLAIRLRNADLLTSFFACFLPILIVYYPLLAAAVSQAKDGLLPPIFVWTGNLVAAAAGIYFLRRVIRY